MLDYTITTVTVAATSFDMTLLTSVKADLSITGTTEDAFLARAITKSSAAASQFCNRVFALQTYQDLIRPMARRVPIYDDVGRQPIAVQKVPLASITSVTENDVVLVSGTDFEIDLEKGYLYRLDGYGNAVTWPLLKIVIVYTAGWKLPGTIGANLPADLEDACIRMVKNARSMRSRESDMKVEDIPGVIRREFWISTGTDGGNMTPDIVDILNNYRFSALA